MFMKCAFFFFIVILMFDYFIIPKLNNGNFNLEILFII